MATTTSTPDFEGTQLAADGLAAVDRDDADPELAAVVVQRLRDLHGQLARRHEDQGHGLSASLASGEPLQDREGERRRFPPVPVAACPSMSRPLEQDWDRRRLDRRRLLVAQGGECAEQLGAQA